MTQSEEFDSIATFARACFDASTAKDASLGTGSANATICLELYKKHHRDFIRAWRAATDFPCPDGQKSCPDGSCIPITEDCMAWGTENGPSE